MTVNRDLLIEKLNRYGIRGKTLSWLSSYLSNRQQLVSVVESGKTYKSQLKDNEWGIAQGSILGPILFIIYLNDLSTAIQSINQNIICYADDTSLLVGDQISQHVISKGKTLFSKVNEWFTSNKLILNKDKTEILLFRTKQNKSPIPTQINMNNNIIQVNSNVKFLGIHINEFLDWSGHVDHLQRKLSSTCYAIRIVSKYLNKEALRIMYFSNMESLMRYGIIFWGRHSAA